MSSIAIRYCDSKDEALQGLNFGFLKVLKSLDKYNEKFALATWIRNILVNHLIDEYRKTKRRTEREQVSASEDNVDGISLNMAEYKWEEDQLRSYLAALPNVTQHVFNLYAIDGYQHKEIAELLNMSIGTSKWHVSDARKRLRKMLEADMSESKKKMELMNK
jgi:RNA polymerase sigma-70 factor (ECF subfamily)